MKRYFAWSVLIGTALAILASPALASEAAEAVASGAGGGGIDSPFFSTVVLVVVICMAVTAIGCGWAQVKAVKSAIDGIARNPGAAGKILPSMLIGVAMIESLAIYVLVVVLILLFSNPFTALIVG